MDNEKLEALRETDKLIAQMYPDPDEHGMSPTSQGDLFQRRYMRDTILEMAPCNYLVWGVGNDSLLQKLSNPGGKTVFIEDNEDWIKQILEKWNDLNINKVEYGTTPKQWKKLLNKPNKLLMDLPKEIMSETWDVIFVDAPSGKHTGRMKSIYTASVLAKKAAKADVFLHDSQREIETAYANKYLKKRRLVKKIRNLEQYSFGTNPVHVLLRRLFT
ncbi:MAG: hypothetical protein MI976_16205 [Pseudomonadales bacterium]|nr:hypothetical protein [Pseudomonadales bacterium]